LARNLLEDDGEWDRCLSDARHMQTGSQLRSLFAIILKDGTPAQPDRLWEKYKVYLCDDIEHYLINNGILDNPTEDQVYDFGLYQIDKTLFHSNIVEGIQKFHPPMPIPNYEFWQQQQGNRLIIEQLAYNSDEQKQKAEVNIAKLNNEQRSAFDQIKQAVVNSTGETFFLHGPAGTGKTFCYNTLCYALRGERKIVLCVASSGIASLLLMGGRTAHSTFKIPIEIHEGKTCLIKKQSHLAELLRTTHLIIWDEVPMQNRFCQEAVDMALRDIRSQPDKPFGGITVVFGGDFHQILPVIKKGSWGDIPLYFLLNGLGLY